MRRVRSGFTLIELLGVITIIVVLVGVSVPAFSGMLRSSRASLADGTLRSALVAARDAALRSVDGKDAAAVFFFEPGGRASIVVCREVGSINGVDLDGLVTRDVFVADPAFEVQELPPNWFVSGLARANTIAGADDRQVGAWYATTRYAGETVNWVFPETGFFEAARADEGVKRHTFAIRYESRSGELSIGDEREMLVYAPSLDLDRSQTPFNVAGGAFRPDRKSDHLRLVRQLLNAPTGTVSPDALERLAGDRATDTILTRQVREIALYDIRDLARELRSERVAAFRGIDSRTGCLYQAPQRGQDATPTIDPELVVEVNRLLARVADVFSIDRYTGTARRLSLAENQS